MTTDTKPRTGRVQIPTGELDGVEVSRINVTRGVEQLRQAMTGRSTAEGEYAALHIDGRLWMSDTDAEWRDHYPAVGRIRNASTKRVLINGLGIGMVVQAAIGCGHVEAIDVVESDRRVIDLIGPHYLADPRVTIHHADAYSIKWAPGVRWDVAWHDIWIDLCTDNLPEMARLHRKYGRRTDWQGSWGKELLTDRRRRDRANEARWSW